jgi:hypothetical protein
MPGVGHQLVQEKVYKVWFFWIDIVCFLFYSVRELLESLTLHQHCIFLHVSNNLKLKKQLCIFLWLTVTRKIVLHKYKNKPKLVIKIKYQENISTLIQSPNLQLGPKSKFTILSRDQIHVHISILACIHIIHRYLDQNFTVLTK